MTRSRLLSKGSLILARPLRAKSAALCITLLTCSALQSACHKDQPAPVVAPASTVTPPSEEPAPPPPPVSWKRPPPHAAYLSEGEYVEPNPAIQALLESEPAPTLVLHAASRHIVRLYEQALLPLEQQSRPRLGLAGTRFDVRNLTAKDTVFYSHLSISSLDTPEEKLEVLPPHNGLFFDVRFSPDGTRLLAAVAYSDHSEVSVIDVASGALTAPLAEPLSVSAFWGPPCQFFSDDELLCRLPAQAGPPPAIEYGPNVSELLEGAVVTVTYNNLLRDANDDAMFEYYGAVQLAVVNLTDGTVAEIGTPGLIAKAELAPNRRYLLSETLARPYSRVLPLEKFPRRLAVIDLASLDVVLQLDRNAAAGSSTSVPWGPRGASWDPSLPARLLYLDRSLRASGSARDAFLARTAPFDAPAQVIGDGLLRVKDWGITSQGSIWLTDTGKSARTWVSYQASDRLTRLAEGSEEQSVGDPSQALRSNGNRGPVLEEDGMLYFSSEDTREERVIFRLTAWNLRNKTQRALWRSKDSEHAQVVAVLDPATRNYLIQSETPLIPPYLLESKQGTRRAVTRPAAPIEELAGVTRQLIRYPRADGVMLSAMLYLPANFRPGQHVPTVFWIYPRDFSDPEKASRVTEHPNRYFEIRGPSRFAVLRAGYALLDGPSMPIIGEVTSGRDDFLPQLVQSAEAAIGYLVDTGITERDQVAVMGRSYGAFAVANLMAHTSLFKVGIAISGAYNRTLTPFGFQRETRTFWQTTEAYVNLSPFFFADKVRGALLLLHGEEDDNPGTPVFQSERFYAALAGNGIKSRFVSFPFEGHQFRGRASVLHASAEIIDWLDRHMKPSGAEPARASTSKP